MEGQFYLDSREVINRKKGTFLVFIDYSSISGRDRRNLLETSATAPSAGHEVTCTNPQKPPRSKAPVMPPLPSIRLITLTF